MRWVAIHRMRTGKVNTTNNNVRRVYRNLEKEIKTSMEVFVTTHMKKLEAEVHGGLKEERNRDKMGKDKRKHFQRSR